MLRMIGFVLAFGALGTTAFPSFAGPVSGTPSKAIPGGELALRIEMNSHRMTSGGIPEFSPDFILADVALLPDKPRRFSNYSGDLSGRYVEALAAMPAEGNKEFLDKLVTELIGYQKEDGRFGNASLKYDAKEMGPDHMALLWGNGRLLVGLVEYYAYNPRPEVLASAKRLGDFLLTVHKSCANDEVKNKFKELAASGMICFSQLVEGLVLLADATGEKAYLDGAELIVPWLPTAREKQHSHGYLTTLRGVVMLYESTHNAKYLEMVENLYGELVKSSDFTVFGGVQEMFGGWDRDEGCSEADFLRLSLQLWRVTGKAEYLDRAEYIYQNQFLANQFATGDFGHHCYTDFGEKALPGVGRAWWCCTMHGLRAFRDVLDLAVTRQQGAVRVNIYTDVEWADAGDKIRVRTGASRDGMLTMRITVGSAQNGDAKISVRKPAWADGVSANVDGSALEIKEENGYMEFGKSFPAGKEIELVFTPRWEFVKRDGSIVKIDSLAQTPVDAVLRVGPWVMGVDEAQNLMFFGEPWSNNCVSLAAQPKTTPCKKDTHLHVPCDYVHDGFFGKQSVELQPICERFSHEPMTFAVWLKYSAAQ